MNSLQNLGFSLLDIHPGLIVAPHDSTDRFTYWPARVAQGGEVLAPDRPEQPVQFIEARDLAAWTLNMIEARQGRRARQLASRHGHV